MGNRSWTDEQLIQTVKESKSYSEIARRMGLANYGANNKIIKKYIKLLQLNTDHFLSKKEQFKINNSLKKVMSFSDIFCINEVDRQYVKKVILKHKLIDYKCQKCGITEYNNEPLTLHLDHINGINNDNQLENLRFLCPNCHSQTDTYCGRNIKREPTKINRCVDCKIEIHRSSTRCRKCSSPNHNKTKIVWPSTTTLRQMVEEMGYSKAGRQLGVSDNAIKKRIRNFPNA